MVESNFQHYLSCIGGGQFYKWMDQSPREKQWSFEQVTGKLYHIKVHRVHIARSWIQNPILILKRLHRRHHHTHLPSILWDI